MTLGHYPKPLNGISNMINNAFRDSASIGNNSGMLIPGLLASGASNTTLQSNLRGGSVPASQLQGDLLQAADAITTNMSNLVYELDQGHLKSFKKIINNIILVNESDTSPDRNQNGNIN